MRSGEYVLGRGMRAWQVRDAVRALVVASSMVAAGGVAPVAAGAQPTAAATYSVDLPRQPLESALRALARQLGLQVVGNALHFTGVTAGPLKGSYTAPQAIERLFAGTGIQYEWDGATTLIVTGRRATPAVPAGGAAAPRVEDSPARVAALEEIVVTGEKMQRSLQETASSVHVVTAQQIEDNNVRNLQDAFMMMANVGQGIGGERFVIRGVDSESIGGGNGRLATIYLDGTVMGREASQWGSREVWDVDQIEVFRGPQSTTQGRNALAGAVVIRTRNPTFDWQGRAQASYAEYGTYQASGALGGPIVDDQLAFRIAVDRQASDGFLTNTTLGTDQAGETSSELARGKLLFTPSAMPDLRLLLTAFYARNESGDDSVDAQRPFERLLFNNLQGHEDHTQRLVSLEADYRVNDAWSLKGIASWSQSEFDRLFDDDQGNQLLAPFDANPIDTKTVSGELRSTFDYGRLRGYVGGYFFRERADNQRRIEIAFDLAEFLTPDVLGFYTNPFVFGQDSSAGSLTRNVAGFMDVSFALTDRVELFGGLRYDREKQERGEQFQRYMASTPPDPAAFADPDVSDLIAMVNQGLRDAVGVGPAVATSGDTTYQAWLPKLGTTYRWTDDVSTSFTVQRGYRAGGSETTFLLRQNAYKPEYTWNYEAALRTLWLDGRLTANANVFYTDWTDQQLQQAETTQDGPIISTDFVIRNAGKSRLYGFELETTFRATRALTLFGSVGMSDTKFIEFITSAGDFRGNRFPRAPRWSVAAGATYNHGSGLFLSTNANYVDDAFNDSENTPNRLLDARLIVNLKAGYRSEQWGAYLFARNLLDEKYIESNVFRNNSLMVGAPRVVGGQVEVSF